MCAHTYLCVCMYTNAYISQNSKKLLYLQDTEDSCAKLNS